MKTPGLNAAEETLSTTSTSIETDGIVAVAASILPPARQQTFIANGNSAKVIFEIVSARSIVIENAYFTGEYPLIQYITSPDIGVAVNQPSGQMGLIGVGKVDTNGIKLILDIFYNAVDVNTSGSAATLKLSALQYKTDDGIYHAFNTANLVATPSMSIVNNIADILFQDSENNTLKNGYKEIAKIVLKGDTAWMLKALPLTLWSPYLRTIPESTLIVKCKGDTVAESNVIQLNPNSRIETVINFEPLFKHAAGEKENLKIYANTPGIGKPGNPIITNMYPLSSFVWKDGLGTKIPGNKNEPFFKNETGLSVYDENQ